MNGDLRAPQNRKTGSCKNPFTRVAAQAGIAPEIVIDVQTACSEYTADKDKNGKSISGTKRAKQLAYINSQNLTTAQKDALYRSVGLAESTLHQCTVALSELKEAAEINRLCRFFTRQTLQQSLQQKAFKSFQKLSKAYSILISVQV